MDNSLMMALLVINSMKHEGRGAAGALRPNQIPTHKEE